MSEFTKKLGSNNNLKPDMQIIQFSLFRLSGIAILVMLYIINSQKYAIRILHSRVKKVLRTSQEKKSIKQEYIKEQTKQSSTIFTYKCSSAEIERILQ